MDSSARLALTARLAGQDRLRLLMVMFVLVTAIIIGAGVHLYLGEREENLRKFTGILETVVTTKVDQVVQWRRERLADARVLAATPFLREHVRHLEEGGRGCPDRRQLSAWLQEITRQFQYLDILLLDARGNLLLQAREEAEGLDSEDDALVAEVIAQPRILLSDFYPGPPSHPARLSLLAPLLEEREGGKVLRGILFFRLDPQQFLFPLLQSWPTPGLTAETLLLRHDDYHVLCLNELPRHKGSALSLRFSRQRLDLPEVQAALGHQGLLRGRDHRGVPVLALARPVPGTSWVLTVKVAEAEVWRTLHSYVLANGAMVVGLILLTALVSHYFWREEQLSHLKELASREGQQKARLDLILSAVPELIFLVDAQGRVLFANQAALEAYGPLPEPPSDDPEWPWRGELQHLLQTWAASTLASNSPQSGEIRFRAGGVPRIFDYLVLPVAANEGETPAALVTLREITQRKETEERLACLNHLYNALSQASDVTVRERQPEKLYQEFCRIAVEEGGLTFAWVALLSPDGRRLEVGAFHGREEGYLEHLDLAVREDPEERCPLWAALKHRQPVLLQDLGQLRNQPLWSQEALRRGFRSLGVIPLEVQGTLVGTMNFYSTRPQYFTPDKVELLIRLCHHLALALEMSVREEQRRQAEKSLSLHTERLQTLLTLHLMADGPTEELLDFVLEASLKILESRFAFLGFVEETEAVLRIHRWSRDTWARCAMREQPFALPLPEGGLLAEAVRQRQPLILNDYEAPHPAKRGLPPGHVPLQRVLLVPVVAGHRVVALAGVANKGRDYTHEDADALASLLNKTWEILRRRETERALEESEAKYRLLVTTIPAVVARGYVDWSMEVFDEKVEDLTGYPMEAFNRRELLWRDLVLPEDIPRMKEVFRQALTSRKPYVREYRIRTRDGRIRWLQERSQILFQPDGQIRYVSGVLFDITERVEAEEKLTASLREKEVLLKEIHHRVKNNLQIISSLFRLQMDQVGHPEVQQVFRESQNRIRSMALVHELLYQSPNLNRISLRQYVQQLVGGVFRAFRADPRRIRLHQEVADLPLGIDLALSCGLILNELVSNSLKHAFPEGRSGQVRIVIQPLSPGLLEMRIEDDGVGLPPELDLEKVSSLGLRLVSLLTAQIHGTLERLEGPGTRMVIRFPYQGHHGTEENPHRGR